jgi:molecular chaperone HtpG
MVQQHCRELLPEYLRFLHGLVDSEDLPLNISRETLQDNAVLRKIRSALTRSVLDRLTRLAADEPEVFATFVEQFGPILKEGVMTDYEHRQRIAGLLRFRSSALEEGEKLTSLAEYIGRAPADQKAIYYLGGADLASVRKNPALEIFRRRGVEVLYLVEPIDEFVMAELRQFDGKELKPIDSAGLELPGPTIETPPAGSPGFTRVLELFREALGDRVAEVRESRRLVDSPCCLVTPDGGLSAQMQRVLRQANQDFPALGRVLEINPDSALIQRLARLSANVANDDFLRRCGLQLWSATLMLEGQVPEPEESLARTLGFLEEAAAARPTLVV